MARKSVLIHGALASLLSDEISGLGRGDPENPRETVEPEEDKPPRRLSSDINKPDYHPSALRVGVRIDGVDRNDITAYDLDRGWALTTGKFKITSSNIEVYWRYPESRQQRRARERWEADHGKHSA